jgi:hypothetical protein
MMYSPCAAAEDTLAEAQTLLEQRNLAAACAAFDRAAADGAEADHCSAGRWMAAMLGGDFEAAWRESDAIRRRGAPDLNRFWKREDLRGKTVIIRCLHGLGDAVQFLRYIPILKATALKVLVEVPPGLLELASCFDGIDHALTWGEQAPTSPPRWDVQVEVTELPYIFRTQLRDLPIAERYLQLPSARLSSAASRSRTSNSMHVGVVWSSGEWNTARSIPLALLQPLLNVPGCEFWNLQGGDARSDWRDLGDFPTLHSAPECANSVLCLAELIAQLDLVITPDTLAAHLAGALGVRTWVLLQKSADWRWMLHRQDSPWYPSMRLFRQAIRGDWTSVIAEVRTRLEATAAESGRSCQ